MLASHSHASKGLFGAEDAGYNELRRKRRWLYLPEGVCLLGEELEVLLGQLHGGQRLQPQVCGALDKAGKVGKGVQAQAVVPVVGQVGHENADLGARGACQAWHTKNPMCCSPPGWLVCLE